MSFGDSSALFLRKDKQVIIPAGHTWAEFLPAFTMAIAGMIALLLAWMVPQQHNNQYLVIAGPLATRGETMAIIMKADGRLVGGGRLANIAFATSSDPDFAGKLRKTGAWAVIDAPQNGGCLSQLTER